MNTAPTALGHPLVRAYLDTLRQECAPLSAARREELLTDLSEHILTSLAGTASDTDVRRVLDALGDPRTVAAAALAEEPTAPTTADAPARPAPTSRTKGLLAVLALASPICTVSPRIGAFVVLAALVLLWIDPLWRGGEKVIASVAILFAPVTLFLLLFGMGSAGGRIGPLELLLTQVIWLVSAGLTVRYLWRRAKARA
ncbi:DUF1700 domain-containing protein [Streptomyces sp. JNUCC 64]